MKLNEQHFMYSQALHQRYGEEYGSVKIVPPSSWKPSYEPWRWGARFRPKIQSTALLSGENRQELAFESSVRMQRFLHAVPLPKHTRPGFTNCDGELVRVKLRKLQLLLSRAGADTEFLRQSIVLCTPSLSACAVVSDAQVAQVRSLLSEWRAPDCKLESSWERLSRVPPQVQPRPRDSSFWVYYPKEKQHMWTRITSGVKRAPGRLPFVQTEISEHGSGVAKKCHLDEEDVDMYIANGDSIESCELASKCLLCEVCLCACAFAVEPDDVGLVGAHAASVLTPPTEEQLRALRHSSPSLMCSGCSMVVHAECVEANSFTDRAVLHHLSRTERDWFCHRCVEQPTNFALKFGYQLGPEMTRCDFEKIGNQTLVQLGLGKPGSLKPASVETLERTFWDLLSGDETYQHVSVLYGSDLDSKTVSSGRFGSEYDQTGWGPRELALNGDSVLKHLPESAQITGVSRPWMYLGSPFSAFCWHAEDQFLCSVSYLHEGASKVWYTVPGQHRRSIEAAMASVVPDLHSVNTDLQHQLVTLVDPHLLSQEFRIPVGRAVQRAGEFIITFPQAYHCGFNSGNNLAEAVNVACADWLPHGRLSVAAYADVKRPSVFSLDEAAWQMAKAVVAREELRKPLAAFALQSIAETLALVSRVTVNGKVGTEAMAHSEVTTCICKTCRQFCYFVACRFENSVTCGYCATIPPQAVLLRHSLEALKVTADALATLVGQCSEIRRSSRASKRSRAK